jgi:predicted DNA-binding protein (MmcQ/YjbR family)
MRQVQAMAFNLSRQGRDVMVDHRDALMARLGGMPGATTTAVLAPRGRAPLAMMYKVMGKLFAIVGLGETQHVILKCDPHLVEILKETYAGVGHRSHLDRRSWISVELEADVPADEIARLVDQSYDLVRASLTRKQREALGLQS